jgi:chorismate mutase
MNVRGVRGATTISNDHPEEILSATLEMLQSILTTNPTLHPSDVASAIFTVTEDITSAFPAKAARQMGWKNVPLMCMREIPVPGSLPGCIRVLIMWNTNLNQLEITHVYLREAKLLRLDLEESAL